MPTPMLRRQERHNEGTLTALMSTESLVQQDGCDNHTREGKPARAYNITQCRRHCLLAQIIVFLNKCSVCVFISFRDCDRISFQYNRFRVVRHAVDSLNIKHEL